MAKLIRGPLREVRSRVFDSARWAGYQPRADDIVIATYPKCGTTWTQRVVSMLVFASAEPRPVMELSPWPDMRLFGPIEPVLDQAQAQTHRRYLKSHLPYDALPVYEGVKYIHVARDGRDAAMSFHNHMAKFTPEATAALNAVSLADPKFGEAVPPSPQDPAEFFHLWVEGPLDGVGDEGAGFFHIENSFWAARRDPNVLLVHYNDLKADRAAEMGRIARFLDIDIPQAVWPSLVEAAGFEAMKRDGQALLPMAEMLWEGGAQTFLHKGTNGRWRDVVSKDDLARYDAKVKAQFSPSLARWIEHGRLVAGDPEAAAN